jgi:hypothetical protein
MGFRHYLTRMDKETLYLRLWIFSFTDDYRFMHGDSNVRGINSRGILSLKFLDADC